MRISILLLCLVLAQISFAQITGSISDENGKPLAGVTVALKKTSDSSVVKFGVSDEAGNYVFEPVEPGDYFLNVSHVGYVAHNSSKLAFNGAGSVAPVQVQIIKASTQMNEVVVVSKKPMVEVRADKTIFNVEGSVNAVGQDALELLRKSPGVMVDKDDNISLSGKNGVSIYIDGRPTPLSGADLAAYLKTLQSSSIEAIEIITNPSAKYDAAGNAGIINIRLKKNKAFGTNGSVNAGYAIGITPKYSAGLAWNHRNRSINIFGNLNYNRNRNEMFMNLYREQLDTLFDQRGIMESRNETYSYKAGFDYFINAKNTFGVMVNGARNENRFSNHSQTPITYIPTGELNKTLVADNGTLGKRNNTNFNLNYRYADTMGRELNIDADYGIFRLMSDQMQRNFYFDADGNPTTNPIYNFVAPTDIDIYTVKVDYEKNAGKGRLGFGGKSSFVQTENVFDRYDIVGGGKNYDSTRSNGFDYTENINALYVNYNAQLKSFMVQFGVRMENTVSEGESNGYTFNGAGFEPSKSGFKRKYTDLFPSGAITFNKNPMSQWGFRYSRRIDRPAYQDLNPFEFKLDEYTFQKGNTELRPQYTNSFAITHTWKFTLNTTLNYSHVNDVFTQLIDTAEKSKSFITKKNLASQDVVSLNISKPFMYKTYSAFVNLNANYSHYEADFGEGRKVDLDAFAYNIYQQHTLKFAKTYTAEISGFYTSPSIWQGTFESKAMWGVDAGLMKTIMQGKATLKASVSDIFKTMQWGGTSNFAGQHLRASGGWESRQFKLNFTYRFGNTQVKAARQRQTSLDEESKRVGTQGGGIGQ